MGFGSRDMEGFMIRTRGILYGKDGGLLVHGLYRKELGVLSARNHYYSYNGLIAIFIRNLGLLCYVLQPEKYI